MDFRNRRKVKQEELGVVMLASEFLKKILISDNHIFRPNHGIKNVNVHTIFFDTCRNAVCALISSPDIPEYVAFQRIMETLTQYDVGGILYPMVALNYQVLELKEVDTPDGQSGMWFGCQEEEDL